MNTLHKYTKVYVATAKQIAHEFGTTYPTFATLIGFALIILGVEFISEVMEALGMFKGVTGTQISFGDRANG